MDIETRFPDASYYFPKSLQDKFENDIRQHEILIFIGNDIFFNGMTNCLYDLLTENHGRNILAFMPDSKHSALADGLGLPGKVSEHLDLIESKTTIPLDIIRCHFVDAHGFPSNSLILNHAIIGLPRLNPSDLVRRLSRGVIRLGNAPPQKNLKQITLLSEGDEIYKGCYSVAAILLGRKITRGVKLRSKRLRINLARFDYVQLNTRFSKNFPSAIPDLISGKSGEKEKRVFSRKFSELEMKGFGMENRIIADGVNLGRLPATFTLLPKALRVISPLVIKPVRTPWRKNLTAAMPKPIINRKLHPRQR